MKNSLTPFTADDLLAAPQSGQASQPESGTAAIFDALLSQESGGRQFDKNGAPITSSAGAVGIAQVMEKTGPEAAALAGLPWDRDRWQRDADYNKAIGNAYFQKQLNEFGNVPQALAAYNAGPGAVRRAVALAQRDGQPDAWLAKLPEETRSYVPAVLSRAGVPMPAGAAEPDKQYYGTPSKEFIPLASRKPGATAGDFVREFIASGASGIGSIIQAGGEVAAAVANKVSGTNDYEGKNVFAGTADSLRQNMTEGGRAALADSNIEGSLADLSLEKLPSSPQAWGMLTANVLGSLASTMIPMVGPMARVASTAKAGDVARLASASRTAKVAGAGFGAAQTGGAAAEEVRKSAEKAISGMTHEQLMSSVPSYAQAFGETGDEAQARSAVVNSAAQLAGMGAAVFGAVGGAVNAKVIEDIILKQGITKMLGNKLPTRLAVGAPVIGMAEGGQEVSEKVGQNIGEDLGLGRDPMADPLRDTAGDFVGGMIGGNAVGGVAALRRPEMDPVARKASEPNSPLSKAATQGVIATDAAPQPASPAPVDPAQRLAELEAIGQQGGVFTPGQQQEYEALKGARDATPGAVPDEIGPRAMAARDALRVDRSLMDALRADTSPIKPSALLKDLSIATSKSAQPAMREQALTRVEMAMEWARANPAPTIETGIEEISGFSGGEDRPTGPRPTATQLRAGVDRDAELIGQRDGGLANPAGQRSRDEADRREQAAIDIESAPNASPEVLDRAVALRQQAASLRRRADEMDAQPGAGGTSGVGFARDRAGIDEQRQANLERNMRAPAATAAPAAPAPVAVTATDQARLESAALAGKDAQRRAEDSPRQVIIDRALRNVEERGGVASPAEARIFQEAGVGKPYDRIDESLAGEPSTDQQLTGATGIALGRAPRESLRQGQQSEADLIAREQRDRSDSRMKALAAERAATQAARPGERAAAPAPSADDVIAALKTIPALRTAEQKSLVDIARRNYTVEQMRVMNDAAVNPANLSATDKLQLQQIRKSEERDAALLALPDVAIPAGNGPAFIRKRKAQIEAAAAQGFETVERRDGVFVIRNSRTGAEMRLSGRADAALAREAIRKMVDERAHAAATSPKNDRKDPSWAQIDAINWKKGDPIPLNGVTVRIENPVGSIRRARPDAPVQWKTTMKHHYGEIAGTKGVDGDPVDVFVGPNPASPKIWVIDQVTEGGKLDEHKVMFGFDSESAARAGYLSNFSSGWKGLGNITEMTQDEFRAWIKDQGATMAPAAEAAPAQQDDAEKATTGAAEAAPDIATEVEPESGSFTVRMDGKNVRFERRGVDALGETESPERDGKATRISKKSAALIKAIAKALGKKVVFFADVSGVRPGDGFVVPNEPNTIYLNEISTISPMAVMGHEFLHTLRLTNPKAWDAIAAVVKTSVKDPKGFRKDYYGAEKGEKRGDGALSEEQGGELEELVSDLGGNLMTDPKFWEEVFAKIRADNGKDAKGIIARLIATLQSMIDKIAGTVKGRKFKADDPENGFVTDLDSIRAAYRDGLAAYLQQSGESKAGMQAEVLKSRGRVGFSEISKKYLEGWPPGLRVDYRGTEAYYAIKRLPYNDNASAQKELGVKFSGDMMADIGATVAAVAARDGFPGLDRAPRIPVYSAMLSEMQLRQAGRGYIQVLPTVVDTENVETLYVNWSSGSSEDEVRSAARAEAANQRLNRIFYGPSSGVVSGLESGAVSRDPSAWAEAMATALSVTARATPKKQSAEWGRSFGERMWSRMPDKFVVGVFEDLGSDHPDKRAELAKWRASESDRKEAVRANRDWENRPLYQKILDAVRGTRGPGSDEARRSPERGMTVTGYHFSREPRKALSSATHGQGLQDANREQFQDAEDQRIRQRIYFYVDKGTGITPLPGLGTHAHRTKLSGVYDMNKDALGLRRGKSLADFESSVLDAGYDGYLDRRDGTQPGVVIMLGKRSITPEYLGMMGSIKDGEKLPGAVAPAVERPPISKGLMSKEIDAVEVGNIPGARMRAGTLTIPADQAEAANAEMARIGSSIRFSKERLATPAEQIEAVRKKYEGTDQWMKSPNGRQTNLSERQWLHVRTPSFKKWFGDWEKFAAMQGGVWNDASGEVSKVVSSSGEPLVVYHGTDNGGFAEFWKPSGTKRGDLGIFTTDDLPMAASYVHLGRGRMLGAGDISEFGEQDAQKPGIYALFLNIRKPIERDFEGANWDGSRNGQFMVVDDDGEQLFKDDGSGYFADHGDAFDLVIQKGGNIEEATDHYESTDSVVREAQRGGSDGAIIRQVVDEGGGRSSYAGEPSDIFVALDPNQVKSADFNGGEYSVTEDDIRKSAPREHIRVHEFEVSTRTPYAKETKNFTPEDARANLLISDFAAGLGQEKWLSAVTELVESYPNYRAAPSADTPEKKLERIVRQMVENLTWLHDRVPAATRSRSKLWYDGANAIAQRWVKKYGITDAQAAGILAVLSPQKDWFMNVSLANRVADILSERQAFRWSNQMDETASRIFGNEAYDEDIAEIRGETLQDIDDPYLRAMWVRVYDQAHNSSSFYIVSPEGDFIAEARTKGGTLGRVAWGGNSTIAKAVSIFENGSFENISTSLGRMHKVRNFYNNILVPNSPNGHVTIDTHAVAAALLRALSGNSLEVKHNFSGPSSAHAGLKGVYALYEEAYRRAAAERGILPREMQSITWEAIRGLYVPTFKAQERNVDAIDAVWDRYSKGRLSYEKARQQVFELGGRIDPPSWEGRDPGAYVEDEPASDDGDVSEDGASAGDSSDDRGAAGKRAGAAARRSAERDGRGRNQGRGLTPLAGAPAVQGAAGPDPRLVEVAERYAAARGIKLRRQAEYVGVDEGRARRIAAAYDAMPHAPQDPKVKAAYASLIEQTVAQYKALEAAGYQFYLFDETNDPYKGNPWNAMRDLRVNKVMGVFATEAGFGSSDLDVADNPLLADTGIKWPWGVTDGEPKRVLANDLFRAVHDAFGHGLEGAGFRAQGEENAWQAHVRLFDGPALGAITSETRGQNSFLNYGPNGDKNRGAKVEDTIFADQKTGLMPEWTWQEGRAADEVSFEPDQDLIDLFEDLGAMGQRKARAETAASAHPQAQKIKEVNDNILDLLQELEDSGSLTINCD